MRGWSSRFNPKDAGAEFSFSEPDLLGSFPVHNGSKQAKFGE